MEEAMKSARYVLGLAVLIVSVGCANERPALDEFSRAYTGFWDTAGWTNQAARIPVDRDSDYWKALSQAMDTRASNHQRAEAASTALAAYAAQTAGVMAVFDESIGSMDSSVTALIETANRIKNEDARAQATGTAKHARALQTAFAALVPLYQRRFELQLECLRDMVANDGALTASNLHGSQEIGTLVAESDECWKEAADLWHKTQDAFSAMKGQFALKTYPSKWADSTAALSVPQ
jgi:hypothetical protein